MNELLKKAGRIFLWIFVITFVFVCIAKNATYVVEPQEVGALVTLGKINPEAKEGFGFKMPGISKVVTANAVQQTVTYQSEGLKAKTMQSVGLTCSIIYQINRENFPLMYRNVDMDRYVETILNPRVEDALQMTIGKNDVLLLVTNQELIREGVSYILKDQLKQENYLIVQDILFSKPKFDPEFEKWVEKTVTEEKRLDYAKAQTRIVEEEAQQALTRAMVDPQVIKELNKVMTNPLIIKYEAMKALQNWNGDTPSTLMLPGDKAMPIIGINGK